jgi:Na+/proline symporter
MAEKLELSDVFEDKQSHRVILKIGLAMLLIMEALIFLVANAHSGSKSWVAVYDNKNDKVYETQGNVMTTYEKLAFESTYGPLADYRVRTEERTVPFPFRAWLVAAVGVPIGFVLLSIYLVRAYLSFVNGGEEEKRSGSASEDDSGAFVQWSNWRRLSVLNSGGLILLGILSLWLVPNFVSTIARDSLDLAIRFKWFFLGVVLFFASLVVWMIYLRYRIAQKMMDHKTELEKFRVEKQMLLERDTRLALPDSRFTFEAEQRATPPLDPNAASKA